jgi:rhomboid protease GluP
MDAQDTRPETSFAAYLARYYMAQKGFTSGTVPEARGLVVEADFVLTRSTGMSLEIVCLVDGEAHPGKRFGMSWEALDEIGRECLRYSGTVNRTKMPVTIHIFEIGRTPITEAQRQRLKPLKRRSFFGKVLLFAWALDVATGEVWTNAPFNGRLAGRAQIERLLRGPRLGESELRAPPAAVAPPTRFPVLTWALIALLAAIFAAQCLLAFDLTGAMLGPSLRSLLAMGAMNHDLVLEKGEWYRLLTATLLHANALHILMNGIALYLAGVVLEHLTGRAWLLALFAVGALCGSLMSLAINPTTVVSVGASGAIMALLAAAYACSYRLPPAGGRLAVQMNLLRVLIPSLIPLASGTGSGHVDIAAHLGGALSGALMALALLALWPRGAARPRLGGVAAVLSMVAVAVYGLAFLPVAQHFPAYAEARLIPAGALPKTDIEARTESADLVARYPHDPRARLFRAGALLAARDDVGAERELRAGLAEQEILQTQFKPELELRLKMVLALVLSDEGRGAEAKTIAQPVCAPAAPQEMRTRLAQAHLCD